MPAITNQALVAALLAQPATVGLEPIRYRGRGYVVRSGGRALRFEQSPRCATPSAAWDEALRAANHPHFAALLAPLPARTEAMRVLVQAA